jgi:hypothetical protein
VLLCLTLTRLQGSNRCLSVIIRRFIGDKIALIEGSLSADVAPPPETRSSARRSHGNRIGNRGHRCHDPDFADAAYDREHITDGFNGACVKCRPSGHGTTGACQGVANCLDVSGILSPIALKTPRSDWLCHGILPNRVMPLCFVSSLHHCPVLLV